MTGHRERGDVGGDRLPRAAARRTIRVGSGGIMLPNHSPLVIAEQFGTLESLYPGRIDLRPRPRAGHRPDDRARAAARPARRRQLPRGRAGAAGAVRSRRGPARRCRPCPAPALEVPLWILGSSTYGAQLAAALGLPYAFASHFAPDALTQALAALSPPVQALGAAAEPHAMAGVNVVVGRHRRRGAAPVHLAPAVLRQPAPRPARPAAAADRRHRHLLVAGREGRWPRACWPARSSARPRPCARASSASPSTRGADELMVVSAIFDAHARRRSYSLLAESPA